MGNVFDLGIFFVVEFTYCFGTFCFSQHICEMYFFSPWITLCKRSFVLSIFECTVLFNADFFTGLIWVQIAKDFFCHKIAVFSVWL